MKTLAKAFLGGGLVCGLCCFTIHLLSGSNVTIPISVEYAKLNPLALLFVWTATLLLGASSFLYYHRGFMLEAFIMGVGSAGMFLVATTKITSGTHELALVLAVSALVISPTLQAFRGDMGLGEILFIAINLSLSLMLVVLAIFQSQTFGLGMAERVWFFLGFLSTTWMLDVPGLAFDDPISI